MQYRCVIPSTKRIANLGKAVVGQLLGQGHGNLTGPCNGAGATFGQDVGYLDLVVLGDGALNIIDTHQLVLQGEQVLERLTNQLNGDVASHKMRTGDDPLECTFQFADVGANTLGNKESRIVRQINPGLLGLLHQNGNAGFQLGRLDSNGQAPTKTRLEPLFQAVNFLGVPVAGENDLLPAFKQRVEGMEELFLRALFLGKELNIVNQQRIDRTVITLEVVDGVHLQRLDHIGDETLGMQIHDSGSRILLQQMVTNRVHQVGLAQANAPIKEQRVIAMLGIVRNLPGSGAGKLVRLALDEVLEGKTAVEQTGVLDQGRRRLRLICRITGQFSGCLGGTAVINQRLRLRRDHHRRNRSSYRNRCRGSCR